MSGLLIALLRELRRRRVLRVASVYWLCAWLAIQLVSELADPLRLPDGIDSRILLLLILGFPLAMVLTWIFEVSSEGVRLTRPASEGPLGRRVRLAAVLLGGATILTSAVLAIAVADRTRPDADPFRGLVDVSEPVPGFSGRAAIAVLPFVNPSEDPGQEYFADGFTEDLITELQSTQSFPVIARTSTFQYKGHRGGVREIAAALGAGYVVEGSIRKSPEEVRIHARVVQHDGTQIWAERYTYAFREILAVQDQVVANIIHAIEPELILSEADRSRFVRTEDMEAWDYYLRALTDTYAPFAFTDLNGRYVDAARLERARGQLQKAIEIDPHFASAYRLLNHVEGAYAFNLSHTLSPDRLKEKIAAALAYGERARLISPFEPAVCSCQAAMLVMSGEVEQAFLLQQEALRHNPSNAVAHAMMGKILQVQGRYEEALEEIAVAKRLSPRSMAMTTFLYFEAATRLAMGDFDLAIEAADRSLLLVPGNFDARFIRILALVASRRIEEARADVESLRRFIPAGATPSSGWPDVFPEGVVAGARDVGVADLRGQSFNAGLERTLAALGW